MSKQALAHKIEALFSRAMFFSASDAEISIEASVAQQENAGHWYVRIIVSNPDGDILGNRDLRIFEDDCEAIIEPITVIIALMMDPEGQRASFTKNLSSSQIDVAEELLKEISSEPGAQEP